MNLLLVEDESSLGEYLERNLRSRGFGITWLKDWYEFDAELFNKNTIVPDLIILDRLLGVHDMADKIPLVKKNWPQTRILVLSAVGAARERARVLELGADDYVNKPFELDELVARIRTLGRRAEAVHLIECQVQNLRLSYDMQDVVVGEDRLNLTRKEFLLLQTLMEHPSRVFSKIQLLDLVWDVQAEIESNVLEVTVKNVRRKLESKKALPKIMSRRNVGYWIEG